MSFCKIYDVDVIANARTVGSMIVVAEYAQFFADTDGGLGQVWDKVLGNAVGQFSYFGGWVCPYRVEITENDLFERSAGMNGIFNNFFANLFGIAVGR